MRRVYDCETKDIKALQGGLVSSPPWWGVDETPLTSSFVVAHSLLGRSGRMTAAVAAIGRGETCEVGVPFGLELG